MGYGSPIAGPSWLICPADASAAAIASGTRANANAITGGLASARCADPAALAAVGQIGIVIPHVVNGLIGVVIGVAFPRQ